MSNIGNIECQRSGRYIVHERFETKEIRPVSCEIADLTRNTTGMVVAHLM